MQDMSPLAEALNRNGYHFISMNLRTAGANGMLYAKFEDCLLDIAAAVKHAKDKGLTNIILLVPSLSAPRAFYYLAKAKERSCPRRCDHVAVLGGAATLERRRTRKV